MTKYLLAMTMGLASCLVGNEAAAEAAPRPNIVFILADDLGWADIGYHDSQIDTPRLDKLAAGGARFEAHYVYPTCSPTRVALLTGRNPSRYGVRRPLGGRGPVPPEAAHLPRGLGALGYATHIVGKWHLGAEPSMRPLRYGFDTSYGYLRGQIDPYTHHYKFGQPTWHRNDQIIEEAGRANPGHVTDLITDEAVRIIESAARRGEEGERRPFFLYVAYSVPHYPLAEPPRWVERYDGRIEDVWRKLFAASVTHMDAGIGRIVEALQRGGQRRDTLILFASDNGGQESWNAPKNQYNGRYPPHATLGDNHPLRGWKTTLYEGGVRVPALANWPGKLEPGTVLDAPIHICDWTPTLLALAGGEPDPAWRLDGRDIWPLLTGSARPTPRVFYWNLGNRAALRQGDWKLLISQGGEDQLFHLPKDPGERENLTEQYPRRVAAMKAILRRERQEQ